MTWLDAVLLGIIQGITEFLPISSSGHLVLAQSLMNIQVRGIMLEVVLHLGTLMSIFIYYRHDLKSLVQNAFNGISEERKYIFYLIIATCPIICTGLFFKEFIESSFKSPQIVIPMLIITGLVLASTYFVNDRSVKQLSLFIVFCVGIAQACALMPGISRSGITISIAMLMGIQRHQAAKFAFFMAIPALLGAGFIEIINIDNSSKIEVFPLIIGFFSAALTGYLVIEWLLTIISKGRFYLFSLYCFTIAIISFILID